MAIFRQEKELKERKLKAFKITRNEHENKFLEHHLKGPVQGLPLILCYLFDGVSHLTSFPKHDP